MGAILAVMPFLSLICLVGENVTTVYLELKDSIYNISWFMWPVRMQQYMVPMLMHADKPITFESFGSLNCSHDTFKKVAFSALHRDAFIHMFDRNFNEMHSSINLHFSGYERWLHVFHVDT